MINTDKELRNKKCSSCRCYKYPNQFFSKDRLVKSCDDCRNRTKTYRDKKRLLKVVPPLKDISKEEVKLE